MFGLERESETEGNIACVFCFFVDCIILLVDVWCFVTWLAVTMFGGNVGVVVLVAVSVEVI